MLQKIHGNNTKLYVTDTKRIDISHWKIRGEKHKNGIMFTIWTIEETRNL